MKKRFSEEQIIGFLKEADGGVPVKELCRKHGFSDASFYRWRRKLGGMDVSDAKRLKALEKENARLKKLLAESMLENEVTREALRKSTDRTGSAGAGAVDDHEEVVGAAQPAGDRDERKRPALPATGRSNRRTEGANHRPGTAASPLRRGDDLPEAAAGRGTRQSQADRAAVRAREIAGAAPPTQEDSGERTAAADPAGRSQRGLV